MRQFSRILISVTVGIICWPQVPTYANRGHQIYERRRTAPQKIRFTAEKDTKKEEKKGEKEEKTDAEASKRQRWSQENIFRPVIEFINNLLLKIKDNEAKFEDIPEHIKKAKELLDQKIDDEKLKENPLYPNATEIDLIRKQIERYSKKVLELGKSQLEQLANEQQKENEEDDALKIQLGVKLPQGVKDNEQYNASEFAKQLEKVLEALKKAKTVNEVTNIERAFRTFWNKQAHQIFSDRPEEKRIYFQNWQKLFAKTKADMRNAKRKELAELKKKHPELSKKIEQIEKLHDAIEIAQQDLEKMQEEGKNLADRYAQTQQQLERQRQQNLRELQRQLDEANKALDDAQNGGGGGGGDSPGGGTGGGKGPPQFSQPTFPSTGNNISGISNVPKPVNASNFDAFSALGSGALGGLGGASGGLFGGGESPVALINEAVEENNRRTQELAATLSANNAQAQGNSQGLQQAGGVEPTLVMKLQAEDLQQKPRQSGRSADPIHRGMVDRRGRRKDPLGSLLGATKRRQQPTGRVRTFKSLREFR